MTIHQAFSLGVKKIEPTSTSPFLDAEVLLSHVLKKPKEFLFINPTVPISPTAQKKFFSLIKKRAANWPVAYLTNHKGFFGLDFYVDKNVLIPRPVTEDLVELVLEKIKERRALGAERSALSILDIGTGSGCIIISLAKTLSSLAPRRSALFFASDISKAALAVAKKNNRTHKTKVQFKQGSLLEPWKTRSFNIIIANLPYLPKKTDPSIKHEPTQALIAKDSGFALIEKLFCQVSSLSSQPHQIFLEIGHDQGPKVTKAAKSILPNYYLKILKDLPGKTRYAVLNKKPAQ